MAAKITCHPAQRLLIRSRRLRQPRVIVGADLKLTHPDRGRDAGYPAPPAQIRTCPIKAYGSYLGYLVGPEQPVFRSRQIDVMGVAAVR